MIEYFQVLDTNFQIYVHNCDMIISIKYKNATYWNSKYVFLVPLDNWKDVVMNYIEKESLVYSTLNSKFGKHTSVVLRYLSSDVGDIWYVSLYLA